jgi:hypothetical protein
MDREGADTFSKIPERSPLADCSVCSSPVILIVNLLVVRVNANIGLKGAVTLVMLVLLTTTREVL